jgi:hypothetical protein
MKIEAIGTVLEEDFSGFSERGQPYEQQGTAACGCTFLEVLFSANPYSCMDCDMDFKADLWGIVFML